MFANFLTVIGARATKYVAAIGFALATFGAAWLKGRAQGVAIARTRALQAEVKAAGERANAENRANREPDPVERLRRDWSLPK